MKRFAALLQMIILLSIPPVVFSQSLADLANKEKERRQQIGAGSKVITNEDIRHSDDTEPAADSANQPSEKPDSKEKEKDATEKDSAKKTPSNAKTPDADEPVDFQGRPESFWRESMADARKKVKDLENEANVLTLKLNDLQTQFYREDDGFKRESIQREIQKTIYEQDQNKENLAKAKDALQDLEKEARKSGALPGWIEPKN
jgi:hypothetical protein